MNLIESIVKWSRWYWTRIKNRLDWLPNTVSFKRSTCFAGKKMKMRINNIIEQKKIYTSLTPYSKWSSQSICKQTIDFISISWALDFLFIHFYLWRFFFVSISNLYLAHDLQTMRRKMKYWKMLIWFFGFASIEWSLVSDPLSMHNLHNMLMAIFLDMWSIKIAI